MSADEFCVHVGGHPETTKRALRHEFELLGRVHPHLSERERFAMILLDRAIKSIVSGGSTFGIKLDFGDPLDQAREIVSNFSELDNLLVWIVNQEAVTEPKVPGHPQYAWAEARISEILEAANHATSAEVNLARESQPSPKLLRRLIALLGLH
ncbi:hypothetical protein [Fontivita pretiosa]|uniref:hypothetical protein n=1 Tax=Fontivita pretiosa TaxID=2989684 RepID=UPI003D183289